MSSVEGIVEVAKNLPKAEIVKQTKKSSIAKKVLFVTLLFASIANNGYAQGNETTETKDFHGKITTGLKIGANYSNVYDRSGEAFKSNALVGFAVGGFVSVPIVPYINFQPELLLSQKGFHATGIIIDGTYDLTRTTSYIDIPLLFALVPNRFFTVVLGPQYSFLINQRDVFANASTSIEREQLFLDDNARKSNIGLVGGVDVNFNHIVFSGRAGIDVLSNRKNDNASTPRYKNQWLQFTIGYRFYN